MKKIEEIKKICKERSKPCVYIGDSRHIEVGDKLLYVERLSTMCYPTYECKIEDADMHIYIKDDIVYITMWYDDDDDYDTWYLLAADAEELVCLLGL